MDITSILVVVAIVLIVVAMLAHYMSSKAAFNTFKKMGIDSPTPTWLLGNRGPAFKLGMFKVQTEYYTQYKDKKVYGWYDASTPILIVRDLDMIKDICVKNFSSFTDRTRMIEPEPPLTDNMLNLTGEHWKRVRGTVSPAFTSGRIRRMFPHVERNVKNLLQMFHSKYERNEEVELKDILSRFTMDVIASTGFGVEANTLENPTNEFAKKANTCITPSAFNFIFSLIFPKFRLTLDKLGLPVTMRKTFTFFTDIIDLAMIRRKEDGQVGKVNDFLDLLMDAQNELGTSEKGKLTTSEIHGQALLFIFAGYETVSTVLSFTLFLLAMHPECLKQAQEEVDQQLGKEAATYDNVQNLHYLDMCINETMRMFPPGFILDRMCIEDVDIQGVHIPKGMSVLIPVYAIHNDPDIYPEPEVFKPERFSPENKESRHPYAHSPFGFGPRNCVGMRLGLLELRVALASVLQKFTPVKCDKTVYPITLSKIVMKANDGLWVKMEARK